MVCYFLTIFYKVWYYFDDFNAAVYFCLEDKINKTKPTHTQNGFLKKKIEKVCIVQFVVYELFSHIRLRVFHVL